MSDASTRLTRMRIDVGDEQVVLERMDGVERLGRPFEFTADVVSPLELHLQPHLGKPASIGVLEDGELLRHFHGLVVGGEHLKESPTGHHYRLQIRPWTHFLSQNRNIAIFQDLTAVDIIKKVLADAGITDVDYGRLAKPRATRVYCVQYKESDFAFVSRLMEEEGIYYFFRHSADRHVMVMCEGTRSHVPGKPAKLEYNANSVSVFTTDSKARFSRKATDFLQTWVETVSTTGVSRVTTRDFDFESPDKPLEAESVASGRHPRDAVERYAFGNFVVREKTSRGTHEALGRERAAAALEGARAGSSTFVGNSQASALACGHTVSVVGHPAKRLNRSYLITSATHSIASEAYRSGERDDEDPYNVRIEAIPADVNFQSPIETPRPLVHGMESATVTAPAGETIYTDEYGRVKVRFHWDRAGTPPERATCWIRVAQTGGLGNVILPRKGHEVLVAFLDGDPDRPLVVGRMFNKSNMPIYDLPANKTRALWATSTYGASGPYPEAVPLGGVMPRRNEVRFEDKGGSEELFIQAERDMNTRIKFQETHHVGQDRSAMVGRDETAKVVRHQKLNVGQTKDDKIGTTLTVEAGTSITLKVKGSSIVIDASGITITGPAVTVHGKQQATLKSMLTNVTATALLKLSGKPTKIN